MTNLARYRKALTALVAAIAEIAALGILPDPQDKWAAGVIAIAASLGVYTVPNQPPEGA